MLHISQSLIEGLPLKLLLNDFPEVSLHQGNSMKSYSWSDVFVYQDTTCRFWNSQTKYILLCFLVQENLISLFHNMVHMKDASW